MTVLSPSEPWPNDEFLQQVAAEFNYAETAFVRKRADTSANDYDLRWFTPVKEVKYIVQLLQLTYIDCAAMQRLPQHMY